MPRCFNSFTARSSTVSVFRPRKSNLTRPAGSTHFMLNWVTGMSDFGSRYSGTSSLNGRSPITMPAAWVDACRVRPSRRWARSEEHTSELQSHVNLVCRLLLEKISSLTLIGKMEGSRTEHQCIAKANHPLKVKGGVTLTKERA